MRYWKFDISPSIHLLVAVFRHIAVHLSSDYLKPK